MSKPRRLWSAREKVYAAALIVFLLGSLLFYAGMSYGQSIGAKNQPDAYNYGGPSGDYTYMVYTFTNDSGVFYSAKDAFGNILWSSSNASYVIYTAALTAENAGGGIVKTMPGQTFLVGPLTAYWCHIFKFKDVTYDFTDSIIKVPAGTNANSRAMICLQQGDHHGTAIIGGTLDGNYANNIGALTGTWGIIACEVNGVDSTVANGYPSNAVVEGTTVQNTGRSCFVPEGTNNQFRNIFAYNVTADHWIYFSHAYNCSVDGYSLGGYGTMQGIVFGTDASGPAWNNEVRNGGYDSYLANTYYPTYNAQQYDVIFRDTAGGNNKLINFHDSNPNASIYVCQPNTVLKQIYQNTTAYYDPVLPMAQIIFSLHSDGSSLDGANINVISSTGNVAYVWGVVNIGTSNSNHLTGISVSHLTVNVTDNNANVYPILFTDASVFNVNIKDSYLYNSGASVAIKVNYDAASSATLATVNWAGIYTTAAHVINHEVTTSSGNMLTEYNDPGLVAHYKFDGANINSAAAYDLSPYANAATLRGSPLPTLGQGNSGAGLVFDGTGLSQNSVDAPLTTFTNVSYASIMIKFYLTALPGTGNFSTLAQITDASNTNRVFVFGIQPTGSPWAGIANSASPGYNKTLAPSETLTTGQSYTLILSYDGIKLRMIEELPNGSEVSFGYVAATGPLYKASTNLFYIGGLTGTTGKTSTAVISEVWLYNYGIR